MCAATIAEAMRSVWASADSPGTVLYSEFVFRLFQVRATTIAKSYRQSPVQTELPRRRPRLHGRIGLPAEARRHVERDPVRSALCTLGTDRKVSAEGQPGKPARN